MAITANKFFGKKEKGGALATIPKAPLVSSPSGKLAEISEKPKENPLFVIKTKVIKIEDLLKGTLAAEKKAADDRKKAQEEEDRKEQEEELETPKTKGKGIKLPLPKTIKSWWQNIKKFFTNVLLGWLVLNFMKWLPKLKGILKFLASFTEFLINFGGIMLNILVTVVHWGYKAFEWTRDAIGGVFGEAGLKTFDKIMGVLNTVMNLQFSLGLAMIAFSNEFGGDILDFGKGGFWAKLFKHGLLRAPKRLLIQLLGPAKAKALLGFGKAAITKTVAFGTGLAKGAAMGKGLAILGKGLVISAAVIGMSGAFTGLEELGSWVIDKQKWLNSRSKENYEKQKDKKWWDPRKWGSWALWKAGELGVRLFAPFVGLFGILGAPMRFLVEGIRYITGDDKQKDAVRKRLSDWDGRIREQFRMYMNMFDIFGVIPDKEGGFGQYGYGSGSGRKAEIGRVSSNDKSNSINSYEDENNNEVVVIKKRQMGRSAAKNRENTKETKVIAVNSGSSSGSNPFANSYRD